MRKLIPAVFTALSLFGLAGEARAERLRDLTEIEGARDNQLLGFGIVTGLAGTGDDASAPVAAQATGSVIATDITPSAA